MTNNEKFNEILNNCQNPRSVIEVLLTLAQNGFFDGKEETV